MQYLIALDDNNLATVFQYIIYFSISLKNDI